MSTSKTTHGDPALGSEAIAHNRARELLGQVMGYVAVTVGVAALLLGLAVAPVIADFADADPSALWQAAGATAAFVAALGAYGYATRRDLSAWARSLFWALLALIVFGIVAIFVSIPNSNVIYAVTGLVIFGGFTIVDFNRLRRSTPDTAVLIAAGIFLDIFNVFLLVLNLFSSRRD